MVALRIRRKPLISLIIAAFFGLGSLQAAARDAVRPDPQSARIGAGIFRSFEIRVAPLTPDRKWDRARAAMAAERPAFAACMKDAAACATPALKSWRELVVAAAGQSRPALLGIVNRFFNGWRYRDDIAFRGVADHWASPAEFMAGSGDCEDYVIAKYFALDLLGFDTARLRLVAVSDRQRGGQHAVLAAYTGGDILILDNVTDRILSHRALPHYVPLRSWNGAGIWAHIQASRLKRAEKRG